MFTHTRLLIIFLLLFVWMGCGSLPLAQDTGQKDCPLTEPVWEKPPIDAAIPDDPTYSYYFVNKDRSIWASAGWAGKDGAPLQVQEEGIKVGWFRPAGAVLEITGQRLDAEMSSLKSEIPCCYPTRFQATGIYFPTAGCWEVNARAEDKELSFVVWVEPATTSP
jgi:hypothetical protein